MPKYAHSFHHTAHRFAHRIAHAAAPNNPTPTVVGCAGTPPSSTPILPVLIPPVSLDQIKVVHICPAAKVEGRTLCACVYMRVGGIVLPVEVHKFPGRPIWAGLPWRIDSRGNWWPQILCLDPQLDRILSELALVAWRKFHHA